MSARRTFAALALAALAALAASAAPDDAAVANRKWVRRYVSSLVAPKGPSVGGTNAAWSASFAVDATNTAHVSVYVPTNAAVFVAWSNAPEIPAHAYYAKVPGMRMYACATNAALPTISYSVTNWTLRSTNAAGAAVSASLSSTRWTATDAKGGRWFTGFRDGDTVLCSATNAEIYAVIRSTTVTDAAARTLRGRYATPAQSAASGGFAGFFAAYAADWVETERGGGTLGYHQGLAMDMRFTSALGGTYTVSDGRDHQYDPYGGVDHADLKGGESWYLSAEAFSDPENWGYSFPLEITYMDQDGFVYKSVVYSKKSFTESPEWQEFISSVELPEPPQEESPTVSEDPGEHKCKVFDAQGNHIGCVCDNPYCKYCPSCRAEYEVTWSDGSKTRKTLSFVGALHNLAQVSCGADGSVAKSAAGEGGCTVCWAADNAAAGTAFCGNSAGTKGWMDDDFFSHSANDPAQTGRESCGCMCARYSNDSDAMPSAMHVQPGSGEDGHGEHCGQDSYCWCFCRREHSGAIAGDGAQGSCPGHCLVCGAFRTVDGVAINGLHPDPLPYRVTDGEEEIDLKDHTPSEAGCGCICGAVSPGNGATRDLLWDADRFHLVETDSDGKPKSCTCMCGMAHETVNDTGHCPKICLKCGRVGERQVEGGKTVALTRPATWEDHEPDGDACGCQCRRHGDGWIGADGGECGYSGKEDGPSDAPGWHPRRAEGACCCVCGEYSDHRSHGGNHADLFVSGACDGICAGVNSGGQRCGRLRGDDRAAEDKDHTPSSTACGCRCGKVPETTSLRAFHAARHGDVPCRCACLRTHPGYSQTSRCRVCAVCGTPQDGGAGAFLDESWHVLKPNATDSAGNRICRCWCGVFSSETEAAPDVSNMTFFATATLPSPSGPLHDFDNSEVRGVPNCLCACKAKHTFRIPPTAWKNAHPGEWCDGVCQSCRRRVKSGRTATEADHTPKARSARKCGCRCGWFGVDQEHSDGGREAKTVRMHPQCKVNNVSGASSPAYCQCFGTGGGGAYHYHTPNADASCASVCMYRRTADGTLGHLAAGEPSPKSGGFIPATAADHVGKSYGCGCKCGLCDSSNRPQWISELSLHHPAQNATDKCHCSCDSRRLVGSGIGGHEFVGSSCTCTCGETHRSNLNACGVCQGGNGSTTCGRVHKGMERLASEVATHSYASDSCNCRCGQFQRDHDWGPLWRGDSSDVTFCGSCGAAFTRYQMHRTCNRWQCGATEGTGIYEYDGEHRDGCPHKEDGDYTPDDVNMPVVDECSECTHIAPGHFDHCSHYTSDGAGETSDDGELKDI